jgi:hypothetical protein
MGTQIAGHLQKPAVDSTAATPSPTLPDVDFSSFQDGHEFHWTVDGPPPFDPNHVDVYDGLDGLIADIELSLDHEYNMREYRDEYCNPPIPGHEADCANGAPDASTPAPADMAVNASCGSTFLVYDPSLQYTPKVGDNGTPIAITGIGFSSIQSDFKVQFHRIGAFLVEADKTPAVVDPTARVLDDGHISATFTGGRTAYVEIVDCGGQGPYEVDSASLTFFAPPKITGVDCYTDTQWTVPCPNPGSGTTVIRGVNFYGATSATVGTGSGNDLVKNTGNGNWHTFDTRISGFSANYASGTLVTVTGPGGTAMYTIP